MFGFWRLKPRFIYEQNDAVNIFISKKRKLINRDADYIWLTETVRWTFTRTLVSDPQYSPVFRDCEFNPRPRAKLHPKERERLLTEQISQSWSLGHHQKILRNLRAMWNNFLPTHLPPWVNASIGSSYRKEQFLSLLVDVARSLIDDPSNRPALSNWFGLLHP